MCGLEMMALLLPAFFVKLTGAYARTLRWGYIVTVIVIIVNDASAGVDPVSLVWPLLRVEVDGRMPRKTQSRGGCHHRGTGHCGGAGGGQLRLSDVALGKDPTMTDARCCGQDSCNWG